MTDHPAVRAVLVRTLLLLALALALAACGPVEVRSAPPGSDLDGLRVEGDVLVLRMLIINRNDIPLTVTGAQLELTLGNETLDSRDWPLSLDLGPRNREAVELRLPATESVLRTLDALERGARDPLPYELIGRWTLAQGGDDRIRRNGFLHPVPGRPGRFR
jgi:hypothetical protein